MINDMGDKNTATITVMGEARLDVAPDMIELTLIMEKLRKGYDEVLELAAKEHEEIKGIFEEQGVEKSEVKTSSFRITSEYETVEEKGWKENKYTKAFVGFKYVHVLRIELPMDEKLLGRIIVALFKSKAMPKTDISYTVKDAESVKNEILRKLTADARTKAKIIAETSGMKLGKLLKATFDIDDEDEGNHRVYYSSDAALGALEPLEGKMRFTPDDIHFSDSMKFVWEVL